MFLGTCILMMTRYSVKVHKISYHERTRCLSPEYFKYPRFPISNTGPTLPTLTEDSRYSYYSSSTMEGDYTPAHTNLTMVQRLRGNNKPENACMREIVPGLFIGNAASSYNICLLQRNNIQAIVSLTSRYRPLWDSWTVVAGIAARNHMWVNVDDVVGADLLSAMKDICDFIDSVAPPQLDSLNALPAGSQAQDVNGAQVSNSQCSEPLPAVLIHCTCGVSRSSTAIAAYLMRKLQLERDDVLQFIRSKQPHIQPNWGFRLQLQLWYYSGYQGRANRGKILMDHSTPIFDLARNLTDGLRSLAF